MYILWTAYLFFFFQLKEVFVCSKAKYSVTVATKFSANIHYSQPYFLQEIEQMIGQGFCVILWDLILLGKKEESHNVLKTMIGWELFGYKWYISCIIYLWNLWNQLPFAFLSSWRLIQWLSLYESNIIAKENQVWGVCLI